MSLIVMAKKKPNFNPLAPPKEDKDDKAQQEKDMKALIWIDAFLTLLTQQVRRQISQAAGTAPLGVSVVRFS